MNSIATLLIAATLIVVTASSCSKEVLSNDTMQTINRATVYGRVMTTDAFGKLQANNSGVEVTLENGGQKKTTITTASGDYQFENLANGTYKLSYAMAGLATQQVYDITVVNNRVMVSTVMLAPATTTTVQSAQSGISGNEVWINVGLQPQPAYGKPAGVRIFASKNAQSAPAQFQAQYFLGTETGGKIPFTTVADLKAKGFAAGDVVYLTVAADTFNSGHFFNSELQQWIFPSMNQNTQVSNISITLPY